MKLRHITHAIIVATIFGVSTLNVKATDNTKSVLFSRVENPDIPKSMNFAGQKIDFDRVDMYERLDRELTSMAYTHGNTLLIIKRANKYFPILAPILKKKWNSSRYDLLGMY